MSDNLIPRLKDFDLNEDFFNPFDVNDTKLNKPKRFTDNGGLLKKDTPAYNPSRIEYKKKGGSFVVKARTHFGSNETVEIAPVILLGAEATAIEGLKDVVYEMKKGAGEYGLVLGYGSLYTHSDDPNISYAYNKKTKQMHFITTRPVQLGEDLTINYGKDFWVARKEFNMTGDHDKGGAAITRVEPQEIEKNGVKVIEGELEESEAQHNVADTDERRRSANFMEPHSNPAVTGVAIKGAGQS